MYGFAVECELSRLLRELKVVSKQTTVSAETLIGPREENQDRGYADISEKQMWAVAVADGLGGHARGAEAAQAAIDQMLPDLAGAQKMNDLFAAADAEVTKLCGEPTARSTSWRMVPMSTLCVAASYEGASEVVVGWSGDTMAYTLQNCDGTLRAYRVGWPHNNRDGSISQCLGLDGRCDLQTVSIEGLSGIAVCSDGAWAPLVDKTYLSGGDGCFEMAVDCEWDADAIARLLLCEADKLGLTDNATVAVACW